MTASLDVLIPTYDRPGALSVTLTSLISQTFKDFRLVISDQNEGEEVSKRGEVLAAARVLRLHRQTVEFHKHLPRQGMAEQRRFLLEQAQGDYAMFLDDDLILEPWVIEIMIKTIRKEQCGLIGMGVLGLSYLDDERPDQEAIEFWDGPVQPEKVQPGTPAWQRHRLHNAANLYHVQQKLGITPDNPRLYRIAWIGGCILYDTRKLRSVGGFEFWKNLPNEHAGEDVLAQLRVMAQYGGAGIIPSGVYHLELPTTIRNRVVDAPYVLGVEKDSDQWSVIRSEYEH